MPPCAAFECERTGWTFARIPTDTPSSAAARAARCPARPAPITSTSWKGIRSFSGLLAGVPGLRRRRFYCQGLHGGYAAPGRRCSSQPRSRLERARNLLDRHNAAQHAVAVHGHDRAEPLEPLGAEQRLERLVEADAERARAVGGRHLAHVRTRPQRLG